MFVRTPEDICSSQDVKKSEKEEDLDHQNVGTNCILINEGLGDERGDAIENINDEDNDYGRTDEGVIIKHVPQFNHHNYLTLQT